MLDLALHWSGVTAVTVISLGVTSIHHTVSISSICTAHIQVNHTSATAQLFFTVTEADTVSVVQDFDNPWARTEHTALDSDRKQSWATQLPVQGHFAKSAVGAGRLVGFGGHAYQVPIWTLPRGMILLRDRLITPSRFQFIFLSVEEEDVPWYHRTLIPYEVRCFWRGSTTGIQSISYDVYRQGPRP